MDIEGQSGVSKSSRARETARAWLARLYDLESTLEEASLQHLGAKLETPDFDAVATQTLLANRAALLAEIQAAKAYFAEMIDQ